MPRLRIVSDLHLEFASWAYRPMGEDILILGGDIADSSKSGRSRQRQLWKDIARAGTPTIYVLGNHEGYGQLLPRNDLVAGIRAGLPQEVHLLDRETTLVQGIRFIGCTLWTDFSLRENIGTEALRKSPVENGLLCQQEINDFRHLGQRDAQPGHPLVISAEDMAAWHREERAWLAQAIAEARESTVVITHFLPSPQSIHPRYAGNVFNAYFASDCRDLIRPPVTLWVHGHTHSSFDYDHQGTRVICNPRGYHEYGVRENKAFQPDFMVDLP